MKETKNNWKYKGGKITFINDYILYCLSILLLDQMLSAWQEKIQKGKNTNILKKTQDKQHTTFSFTNDFYKSSSHTRSSSCFTFIGVRVSITGTNILHRLWTLRTDTFGFVVWAFDTGCVVGTFCILTRVYNKCLQKITYEVVWEEMLAEMFK